MQTTGPETVRGDSKQGNKVILETRACPEFMVHEAPKEEAVEGTLTTWIRLDHVKSSEPHQAPDK